jgi:hypothetical protein
VAPRFPSSHILPVHIDGALGNVGADANLWTRSVEGSKSYSFNMFKGSARFNEAVRASSALVGTLKSGGQMSLAPPSAQAAILSSPLSSTALFVVQSSGVSLLWTRSVEGSKSYSFNMFKGSARFNEAVRTMGFSVRCIRVRVKQ